MREKSIFTSTCVWGNPYIRYFRLVEVLRCFTLLALLGLSASANTIMPTGGTSGSSVYVSETGPPGAPMTVSESYYSTLLGSDQPILNPDGSRPQDSFILPQSGSQTVKVPKTVTGFTVSDIDQSTGKPGDPADPGYLYIGAFAGGPMFA
jgi:hypothetical protein